MHPPDHINLRVTYLIAGNPRPPCALGLVPASTTIAALKARLQQELLEHPLPHEQRLIYQGRPLLQSDATLQDALRLQAPIGPLPYTIHIIIARPAPPPQDTLSTGHTSSQANSQHATARPQLQQQHDDQQAWPIATAAPVQAPLAHPRLRHLPIAADPMPRPSSAPTHPQHRQQTQFRTVLPFPAPQTHLPFPFPPHFASIATPQLQPLPPPSQTTVWLASSSNGPQALLFAPGHGYFTSASPPPFFAFVLRRGWLFMRLYMFMFFLSEAGTWRRYLLLLAAIIVCILPRQNPLNDAIGIVRRHLDRLIGPPPRPQRERPAERAAAEQRDEQPAEPPPRARILEGATGNATEPTQRTRRGMQARSANPSPEETAERLLREHRDRHPTPVLDALYSIEQAIALFLASLFPGVGERHVAAREQFRREEREARARAAQERAAQLQQEADRNNAKDSHPPAAEQASSSAVDAGPSNSSSASTRPAPARSGRSSGSHET
ncbi:hypothetical protein DV736_g4262, partial [Chaetothyriales sp. CBS 134916]